MVVFDRLSRQNRTIAWVILGLIVVIGPPLLAAYIGEQWAIRVEGHHYGADETMSAAAGGGLIGFLVGVAGVIFLWVRVHKRGARRRKQCRAWLTEQGFSIDTWLPTADVDAAPFNIPGTYVADLSYAGVVDGQHVSVLHYRVNTGTRKEKSDQEYTVVLASGNSNFPLTALNPQRGFHAVAAVAGLQDIDTESAAFNRRWRVRADSPQHAHDLLFPSVIERLLEPDVEGLAITWSGAAIVTTSPGYEWDVEELERRVRAVADLANLVPGFARSDGERQGAPSRASAVTAGSGRVRVGPTEGKLLAAAGVAAGGAHYLDFSLKIAIAGYIIGGLLAVAGFTFGRRRDRRRRRDARIRPR